VLGRPRPAKPDSTASYAVLWASLRKRFPGLRTILVTAASYSDDATVAALGVVEAAVGLDGGAGLVLVLDAAMRDRRHPDPPGPSVQIIVALSVGQVRTVLSELDDDFGVVIIVAPPPQQGTECIAIAGAADAAILVARSGKTRFAEAQLAAELLRHAGVTTAASLLLTRRAPGRPVEAQAVTADGQIAELRPRAQLEARGEPSVGIELLN